MLAINWELGNAIFIIALFVKNVVVSHVHPWFIVRVGFTIRMDVLIHSQCHITISIVIGVDRNRKTRVILWRQARKRCIWRIPEFGFGGRRRQRRGMDCHRWWVDLEGGVVTVRNALGCRWSIVECASSGWLFAWVVSSSTLTTMKVIEICNCKQWQFNSRPNDMRVIRWQKHTRLTFVYAYLGLFTRFAAYSICTFWSLFPIWEINCEGFVLFYYLVRLLAS